MLPETQSNSPSSSKAISVEKTTDTALIRRWLMKPSVLRRVTRGIPEMNAREMEIAFALTTEPGANLFYSVRVDGAEKGIIMFAPVSGANEMHLCLGTWFSHTRRAVRLAMMDVGGLIVATYSESNRAATKLLDDVGFTEGSVVTDHYSGHRWKYRTLNVDSNPAYRS